MPNQSSEVLVPIRGQPHAEAVLDGLLRRGRFGHAYVFAGQAPAAMRDAALQAARLWICPRSHPEPAGCADCSALVRGTHPHLLDLRPLEGRTGISVEQILQLRRALSLKPERDLARVVLVDPASSMSEAAMNSLLKILEEPPDRVILALLTDDLARLLPTVLSRCHVIRFYPVSEREIVRFLRETSPLAPSDLALVASLARGSFETAAGMAREIQEVRGLASAVRSALQAGDLSGLDLKIKAREAAETRRRSKLVLEILARDLRESMSERPGQAGRLVAAIETFLDRQAMIEKNANTGLCLADALLEAIG